MPIRAVAAAVLVLASASLAAAQVYPSRPVTFVVPFAPGGSSDTVARIVAQAGGPALGQPTVVENHTGGAGTVGWGSVARAAPDGHTLITIEMSYAIAAGLIPSLPFDPRRSFAHIATAVSVPHVMVVNPAVKAGTVSELIALAKASPGKLFYGSDGVRTNSIWAASCSARSGWPDAVGNTPPEAAQLVENEMARWASVAKAAGISMQP